TYYLGELHVIGQDGEEATESILIVRETLPETGRIEAKVATWTDLPYVSQHHLDITLDASGNTFTVAGRYLGERIEGTGSFQGDRLGVWTSWQMQGQLSAEPTIKL